MSQATTCPGIIHDVQNYSVVQEKAFNINIAILFKPDDGTLNFYIKEKSLSWLHLEQHLGVLHGIAPRVPYNKRFKFTITASNEMGSVTKSFILIVVDTEVVETMPQTLELILSMRNQEYGYRHLHPYTPSLIEYIYFYFHQPEYSQAFIKSVHIAAEQYGIKCSDKVTCYEFENLLKKINPDLEQQLRKTLEQDHILTKETLNNEQLQNLFRLGDQQPGSITIPVWNHCAYPDLFNWPEWQILSNVIHAGARAVRRLKAQNFEFQEQHQPQSKLQPR